MPGRLQNKIAIITGSSSGIGRATAIKFAGEGANVVCSDIREEARTEGSEASQLTTVQEVEKLGQKAIYVKCDTGKSEEVENLVRKAVEKFGRVDIMMNNAGIAEGNASPIWDFDEAVFDRTIAINLKGVFLGTKYAAKQMKEQEPGPNGDRGWIVNVASILGLYGVSMATAYVASKHGVMGVTKTAAWDCAPHRIHVNAVCPGYTATALTKSVFEQDDQRKKLEGMHPFRGLGTADDIARAALFLASEDAAWVTGIGLPIDGGYTSL